MVNNTIYPTNIHSGANGLPEINNNGSYNTALVPSVIETQNSSTEAIPVTTVEAGVNCNFIEKYRVRDFNNMIGNEDAIKTLITELAHNFYQNVKIFYGPPSSGKSSAALIQAKAINCQNPREVGVPCDTCNSCKSAALGTNQDIIRINAGSNNGVDTAREIAEEIKTAPLYNKKVIILEEWQKMSPQALTALLDVMENPTMSSSTARQSDYLFIMPTTELPTDIADNAVLSRAIIVNFYPIPKDKLITRLEQICNLEQITIEDGVLDILYNYSSGAMRDCLKNLQSLAVRGNFNITVEDINNFFYTQNSNLGRELFNAIHSLNPVNVNSVIENHCNKMALMEGDFNSLANIFIEACNNTTPFMQEVYTKCLRIIRDNRIVFLRDPSKKVQDNLIIACNEILSILRENAAIAICDFAKQIDINFGNLLLSLNPSIRIDNRETIFTINPPTLGMLDFSNKIHCPGMHSIFNLFNISRFEFNNIGRDVCFKIATEFDRNLGELLMNSMPMTIVDNGQLIFTLAQPTNNLPDYINKINSHEVISIFNYFGISKHMISGLIPSNTHNAPVVNAIPATSTTPYAGNTIHTANAIPSAVNTTPTDHTANAIPSVANTTPTDHTACISKQVCNQIALSFSKNFGEFLLGLNPTILKDANNQLVISIEKPTAYSDGSPINIDHFESFLLHPTVRNIFASNGIIAHQYR